MLKRWMMNSIGISFQSLSGIMVVSHDVAHVFNLGEYQFQSLSGIMVVSHSPPAVGRGGGEMFQSLSGIMVVSHRDRCIRGTSRFHRSLCADMPSNCILRYNENMKNHPLTAKPSDKTMLAALRESPGKIDIASIRANSYILYIPG